MNLQAGLILLIPLLGLVPICRDGKWNWKVVKTSILLNGVFWLGWTVSLAVGLLNLFSIV